jgi:hypothetical protein
MVLRPGRMKGIAATLRNDMQAFPCHKTTHDYDDEEGRYQYDGTEQACMGALAYAWREYHMLPVLARIACARGETTIDTITACFDQIEARGK